MNGRRTVELPLDVIALPERLRTIDDAHVEQLAESLERRGLDSPIQVREPDADGKHLLIAGAHRLTAARKLRWRTIECFVVAADDSQALLIEIEENLVRHDLTELDRAVFLAKWKELYSQIAETRGRGRPKREKGTISAQFSLPFSKAVHERLKMQPRSVNRAVARASLPQELRNALSGHPAADNGNLLDLLVTLSAAQRLDIARAITPAMSIGEIRRRANGYRGKLPSKPADAAAKAIYWFDKCSAEQKAMVRRHVAARSGRGGA